MAMMVLLDAKAREYADAERELGLPVGQLLTPLTQRRDMGCRHYAIDNGAFAHFDRRAFFALLARQVPERARCLFVVVPDVVGSARRTNECFEMWAPQLGAWPLAYAAQDGAEDLPIPWSRCAAVFVGGSTRWKTSEAAKAVIRAAQVLGKHVHVGRVNTADRAHWCDDLGVDSVDGTGISQYSHMRHAIKRRGRPLWDQQEDQQREADDA
jgi:hypothetical protein